jgi:CSLREA domain-containing protein
MMLSYSAFKWMARLLGGVAAMGAFALAANTASAGIITVTTALDEFNTTPDTGCSLREAIQAANTNAPFDACPAGDGADTIVFDTTAMGGTVITLTIQNASGNGNDDNEYLDLDVVVDQDPGDTTVFTLTIQGGGVKVIRDFNSTPQFQDRIFDILPPGSGAVAGGVRIENLFIETGLVTNASEETVLGTEVCYLGGAGVRHRSGGLLEIDGGTVSFNYANGNGGGICQDGGRLQLVNYPYIATNQAPFGGGGGIYISGTADLTVTLQQNIAQNGGGVYVSVGSTVTVTNSGVTTNTASSSGGGIWNAGALTINGGSYNANQAQNGGGIYNASDGSVTLTNAGVSSNIASANGGGVYNLGAVSISSAGVGPNNGANNGGGIWNNGVLTITSAGVTTNTASANGGGIYNASNGTATLTTAGVSDNQAPNGSGGGIYNDGTLNITSSGVDTNQAIFGGGIYNGLGAATVNLAASQVNGNSATQQGGGIYNQSATALHITGTQVNSNTVTGSGFSAGGGVYNDFSSTIYITNSSVNSNTVTGSGFSAGGGVCNFGAAEMRRGTIAGNVVSATNNAQGGGAFNGGALLITATLVAQNTATATQQAQGGGAFNAASGVLTVTFSTLEQNQARGGSAGQGGGAFSSGTMQIEGSTVQANTATSDGGGVYRFNGLVDIVASTLAANQAISDGGGLYNNASVPVGGMVVQHSAVVSNTAQRGGSAYNLAGLLLMRNSTVSGNSGNGAIYADDSDPGPASSSNTQLQFVTVASNTGSVGLNVATGANATAYATLLAYNSGGNCAGFAFPLFSLSSDASCLGMSMGNPLLKPLALNGGGTLNHALSLGSPAIDKVPAAFCTVSTDQRYFSRPWFLTNACDIGAFELQPYYPVFVPIVFRP